MLYLLCCVQIYFSILFLFFYCKYFFIFLLFKHENGILPFLVDVTHSMIHNFRPTYGPCYAVILLIFVVVCLMAGKYFIIKSSAQGFQTGLIALMISYVSESDWDVW